MGNLNVFPGSYAKIIFDKLNKKDFHNIIEKIYVLVNPMNL